VWKIWDLEPCTEVLEPRMDAWNLDVSSWSLEVRLLNLAWIWTLTFCKLRAIRVGTLSDGELLGNLVMPQIG